METRFFLFSLMITLFSFQSNAQCGTNSNANKAKAVHISYEIETDIVVVAASLDQFSTLVTAVKAADLVVTLKSDGPFTVFAPTNDAFDNLPEGTVTTLLKPENKSMLANILTYHVVAGKFTAEDIVKAIQNSNGDFTIETVSGGKLRASIVESGVVLTDEKGNKSNVIKTDVAASNGVIHVLDAVVLPN